jgi:signal transduction histidine kinase
MAIMRSPRFRLVALLTVAGVSYVALLALGWGSLNRFESEIERVLRQACSYTAQQIAQQIQRDFKSPVFNLLEQVDHTAIKNLQLAKIAETLQGDEQHFLLIDTFFFWSVSDDPAVPDRAVYFYSLSSLRHASERAASSTNDTEMHGFYFDERLSSILKAEAAKYVPLQKNFALSYLNVGGRTYHLVYHFLFNETDRRQLYGFEGFLADPEHLRESYFANVISRHRNEPGATTEPALAISILDDAGKEVYQSGRSLLERYETEVRFPFFFFDTDLIESLSPFRPEVRYWTVRTGYEAGNISGIVREQSMQQWAAWAVVGLVAVVGIALAARGMTREVRLAEMKSEFVASVSHDLKTPLAKIQLFADTLESGRARTREKEQYYHRVISHQSRKLAHLIGELLDFSKIEAGVRDYRLEELDLRAIVQASIEVFDHELTRDCYELEVSLPDREVPVLGSPEALHQLFGNLIANALKYSTSERFLRVTVSVDEDNASVEITDRGIGIPKREQRKIFRKFYRGSGAIGIAATGSGIGLAIVDHVVRAHGGSVSVSSVPGQGSTFTVKLPLCVEADLEHRSGAFASRAVGGTGLRRSGS